AGFDLSFEIDFWGRFRRATEAARANLVASEEGRRLVISTLVTDVATDYFQLRSLDRELEVSQRTLAARQDSLRLVSLRERGGVASLIDVRQAEILVAQAGEAVVETQRQIEQTENALSVLLGRNPDAVPRGRPLLQQLSLPTVPTGVPSSTRPKTRTGRPAPFTSRPSFRRFARSPTRSSSTASAASSGSPRKRSSPPPRIPAGWQVSATRAA